MHRPLVRLGALALSTFVVTSCASLASDTGRSKDRAAKGNDTTSDGTVAVSLDSEIGQARLLRQQGDFAGAIHMLSQLMLAAPDDPRVVGEYGKTLTQQGRSAEALDFLRRAVALQPGDWTLYSAMGVAYDGANDPANAQAAYQHALALKPGEAVVLNNYAMSRVQAGDLALARQLIAQASAAGSPNPKIVQNLALINGLTPPPVVARSTPGQSNKPQQQEPFAQHAPRPLVAVDGLPPPTVVRQAVPFDPKAAAAKPAKTKSRKLAAAPKLRQSASRTADQIPALRLAGQ